MTRAQMARVLVVVLLAMGATAAPASAAADPSPPGANDFSCRPSAAHPRPLVLVHGLGATMGANWGYMSPRLKAAGYCVFALTYGVDPRTAAFPYSPGGVVAMERSAPELAALVDRVLAATGASKVDLVGHSEGTVMPRYYLKFLGGAAKVDKFVALTPLWRGTDTGGAATLSAVAAPFGLSAPLAATVASFCGSCPQFLRGSPFLARLNEGGEAVPGITYTSIVTRYDELVIPYTSGIMQAPGATNIVLQDVCPTDLSEHVAVASDPVVDQLIRNALDPANATPVRCGAAPPLLGASTAPKPGPSAPSGAAAAPSGTKSARSCASRRTVVIHLGGRRAIVGARATVAGKRVNARRVGRRGVRVSLRTLPRGTFTVVVRARTAGGRRLTATRRLRTCAPRAARGGRA